MLGLGHTHEHGRTGRRWAGEHARFAAGRVGGVGARLRPFGARLSGRAGGVAGLPGDIGRGTEGALRRRTAGGRVGARSVEGRVRRGLQAEQAERPPAHVRLRGLARDARRRVRVARGRGAQLERHVVALRAWADGGGADGRPLARGVDRVQGRGVERNLRGTADERRLDGEPQRALRRAPDCRARRVAQRAVGRARARDPLRFRPGASLHPEGGRHPRPRARAVACSALGRELQG